MEEKLDFPRDEIIDTNPGSPIKTPRILPRPAHLKLREDGVKASHPSQARLVDEKERGKLLHFFGNHELLATELMALVLLKFPDAPASFRQGVLETLKEEQIHTQLYMHRMEQCGIEFGELPLNDYFWKSVSTMEDPLDYVTRLSLTFEQANLDYSREYKTIFDNLGDQGTANILDKIYRDEIDHVGFGLKWFRRWKENGKTDWEAFRERLVFPLSPARAKGNFFNEDGRIDAGLDASFIKNLHVFSQSRGRTPSVHWFNPDSESFAAQNSSKGLENGPSPLQSDLSFLPAYLCRKDDILITPNPPSPDFLKQIQSHGFQLPEIAASDAETNHQIAPEIPRKIGRLRPWAWTPDSTAFFKSNYQHLTNAIDLEKLWNTPIRNLYSKIGSAHWAANIAKNSQQNDWIAPPEVYGNPVTTIEELAYARTAYAKDGYDNIVCKAPFGTAANGLRCLLSGEDISPPLLKWLETIWKEQGEVLVEPWLDRVFDFSVQYEKRENEELKFIAFTRLVNNVRGQFRGIITNAFCRNLDPAVIRFIMRREAGGPRLYKWYEKDILAHLEKALASTTFQGPLGLDAFIYRDPNGYLKLKSVVEINPRVTMGRIAHEISIQLGGSSIGYFQIISRSQLKKTKVSSFTDYCTQLAQEHPIQRSEGSKPTIISGSFPLTDPRHTKQFLALYHVRNSLDDIPL